MKNPSGPSTSTSSSTSGQSAVRPRGREGPHWTTTSSTCRGSGRESPEHSSFRGVTTDLPVGQRVAVEQEVGGGQEIVKRGQRSRLPPSVRAGSRRNRGLAASKGGGRPPARPVKAARPGRRVEAPEGNRAWMMTRTSESATRTPFRRRKRARYGAPGSVVGRPDDRAPLRDDTVRKGGRAPWGKRTPWPVPATTQRPPSASSAP